MQYETTKVMLWKKQGGKQTAPSWCAADPSIHLDLILKQTLPLNRLTSSFAPVVNVTTRRGGHLNVNTSFGGTGWNNWCCICFNNRSIVLSKVPEINCLCLIFIARHIFKQIAQLQWKCKIPAVPGCRTEPNWVENGNSPAAIRLFKNTICLFFAILLLILCYAVYVAMKMRSH